MGCVNASAARAHVYVCTLHSVVFINTPKTHASKKKKKKKKCAEHFEVVVA